MGVQMDKGTLYRLAASYLGEYCVKEDTSVYQALNDVVQHALGLALDYTSWPFALARVTLTPDADGAFALPADCLEIRECSLPSYEMIGRKLYARNFMEHARVTLTYKSSVLADTVCLPDYEPFFCEGCVLLLASKAAPRVTSNMKLAQSLEQEAYGKLYRAKLKIVRSTASNDQDPDTVTGGSRERRWRRG